MRRASRARPESRRYQLPRPRVLIENSDYGTAYAAERILERRGYEVSVCGGPDHLRGRRCPLVAEGRCELVDDADVVVHGLDPDRPDHRAVLAALREERPSVPIVAEMTAAAAERHADLLEGCTVVSFPVTTEPLRAAVRTAIRPLD
jgi:hypothetical protein